jgi:glutathione S-transferase
MKLFFNKFSRGTRVRWLVEELGIPCEIVTVDMRAGEHKRPEYLAIHPHGKVPALVDDDGTPIMESAAIILHLADRHPGLAPEPGQRGRYYQWIIYGMVNAEPPVYAFFKHTRQLPEDQRDPAAVEAARRSWGEVAAVLSTSLDTRDWLLGGFSAADIVVGSIVAWADSMGMCEDQPVMKAYAARCRARPAFAAARD